MTEVKKSEEKRDERLVCKRLPVIIPEVEVSKLIPEVPIERQDQKVKGRLVHQFKVFHPK